MTEEVQPTLEELASKFEAQTQPAERVESQEPPKFEKAEEAVEWLAKKHSETEAQLRSVTDTLSKQKQDDFVKSQMDALDTAIKTIGKEVELDPMFIEGALHTTYNRDKNFQKIFDNREQNPEAYQKALSIVASQLKSKSVVQHDPQIAENKRALEQLQKSARSGTSQEKPEDATKEMSAAQFDHYWEKLKAG